MKRLTALLLAACLTTGLHAQGPDTSHRITAYPKFKPASITMMNGKVVTVARANVFLKGSRLVYHNISGKTMEARIENIRTVDFDDRHYERIDTMLAWRVDTVGANALYCVSKIDMASLRNRIINSRDMTNIDVGNDLLNFTTLDIDPETLEYPIINVFYFYYHGKMIPAHEREVMRRIPKERLYDYNVITSQSTFSWTDRQSLLDLLRRITK